MEVVTDENTAGEGSPSIHVSEHCYCKLRAVDEEPMETDTPAGELTGSPSLTSLDASKDTFETFLLHLLQAFTLHQNSSTSDMQSESDLGPQANGTQANLGPSKFSNLDISTDSLNSLSPEQVSMLITSNSVNYEVIQQILAQKQKHTGTSPSSSNSSDSKKSPSPGESSNPPQDTPQENSEKERLSLTTEEAKPASSSSVGATAAQQLPQLQVTPEQLQVLQERVSELLRQQEISLPADIPMEQQHALIQTLLIRQMHLMQEKGESYSLPNIDDTAKKTQPKAEFPSDLDEKLGILNARISAIGKKYTVDDVAGKKPSDQDEKKPSAVLQLLTGKEAEENKSQEPQTIMCVENKPQTTSAMDTTSAPAKAVETVGQAVETASKGVETVTKAVGTLNVSKAATTVETAAAVTKPSTSGGKKKKSQDPNEPKKPPMPYNIFFSEVYSTVLAANQKMGFAEASKIISMMWNAMGSDVKKKYHDQHEKLKQEYKEAMQKYQATKSTESPLKDGDKLVASSPVRLQREPKDPSLCVNDECTNAAVFSEERGPRYCSNECVITHCRNEFTAYVHNKRIKT